MPTTRKQKKTRKSGGAEMLSDIENLDIMLEGNRLEREVSEHGGSSRKSNSLKFKVHENNEENHYPSCRENRSSNSTDYGNNSAGIDSSAELNWLSGELECVLKSNGPLMMQ